MGTDKKNSESRPEDLGLQVGAKKLHEGRKFMYDRLQAYWASFRDPNTGLLKEEFLEPRHCPVCGSAEHTRIFYKNGGAYVKCQECSMCYLNPVFKDAALQTYYENNHALQAQVTANESEFYRRIYSKGLEAIHKFFKAGRICDIGCSSGFFLDLAREAGWQTTGLELNRKEAELAEQRGHKVYTVPVEEAKFAEKFNAVTLWDVFEHIKTGSNYLETLKKLLVPGGLIFMQIPNSDALAARILHEHCNMFDGIEHVNLYSPKTIGMLLEKHSLKIEHMETVISEIPVVNNFLNYENPYFGSAPLQQNVLGLIDEEALHKALLGYKMQIVARLKD